MVIAVNNTGMSSASCPCKFAHDKAVCSDATTCSVNAEQTLWKTGLKFNGFHLTTLRMLFPLSNIHYSRHTIELTVCLGAKYTPSKAISFALYSCQKSRQAITHLCPCIIQALINHQYGAKIGIIQSLTRINLHTYTYTMCIEINRSYFGLPGKP